MELISDLTTAAFIACLHQFIAYRSKPVTIWSDHESNFVGAEWELSELFAFLNKQSSGDKISNLCSSQGNKWSYIQEHAPHFGGLWESTVKSVKNHLRRILGEARLNFEDYSTVLAQIKACPTVNHLFHSHLNMDRMEALTPGHFLIGYLLEALPDSLLSTPLIHMPLLHHWIRAN